MSLRGLDPEPVIVAATSPKRTVAQMMMGQRSPSASFLQCLQCLVRLLFSHCLSSGRAHLTNFPTTYLSLRLIIAKLYGQHFVQTRPQAAPASAAVVQSHRPASTGIESVTSEMAGAALEPKQATSTQAPPGPQAAGAPAATSVWGAKRSFSEVRSTSTL